MFTVPFLMKQLNTGFYYIIWKRMDLLVGII